MRDRRLLQDAYITDSVGKRYNWYRSQDRIFIGWKVIILSGVTTRVHSVSYQATFSDFERGFELLS
jgi:hypothetical protein